MNTKVYTVNCEVGPNVEEAFAQMQQSGYRFAQLVMPNGTYGWLIGVRDTPPAPVPKPWSDEQTPGAPKRTR